MSFRDFQTILLKFSDMTRIFHDLTCNLTLKIDFKFIFTIYVSVVPRYKVQHFQYKEEEYSTSS